MVADAVADEIGERARLAHEPVDAENHRQPGRPGRRPPRASPASVTKPAPVTPAAPLDVSIAHDDDGQSAARASECNVSACAMNSDASVM